jgi:DNA-binding beta-propeller fold protein YncE
MFRPSLLTTLCATAIAAVAPAVASADLKLQGSFGGPGTGDGQFSVPEGIAVDGAGNVYVADGNHNRIEKFGPAGNFLLAWGGSGSGPGQFNGPGHMGLDPQGNVLVADEGGYRVQKFSPTGTFLLQYGRFGQAAGQYRGNPRGVAADSAGNVYVVDTGAQKVLKFAANGTYLTEWGTQGTGPGQWRNPRGVAVDAAGDVYVGDIDNDQVDVFHGDGAFVRSLGGAANTPADLGNPIQSGFDSEGNVFVGDNAPGGIVQFTPAGAFAGRTSTLGSVGSGFRPLGLAVGPTGDVFVTDQGTSRVLRFSQTAPTPVLGKTAAVQQVTGRVLVRTPGSSEFVSLTKNGTFPMGSMVDTTSGSVSLSLAKAGKGTQSGTFKGGRFRVTQAKKGSQKGLTEMTLSGGSFKACGAKGASAHAADTARRPCAAPSGSRRTPARARSPRSCAAPWWSATS